MAKYQVTVYKAAPGSNSPANVVRTVEAESDSMALKRVREALSNSLNAD
jgi:hypothetical protein